MSIRQRGDRFQAVVYAGRVGRKSTYLRETHATLAEARRAETRLKGEVEDDGPSSAPTATVAELLDRWLARVGPELSPTTLRTYRGYIEGRIKPELGATRLRKLKAAELDRFYSELRQTLSPATVRHIHAIIRSACTQAIKWGWIGTNPASKATPPKLGHGHKEPPDPTAMRALLAKLEVDDPELGMFLRLAAITGARRGELCALRWSDLDLALGTVTISRALICANGTTVEKTTKTHGIRRLALDPITVDLVDAHRAREAAKKADLGGFGATDFVFSRTSARRGGKAEGPWHPDAVTHRYKTVATAAGITAGLHDWRHWAATHALAGGISVRQVADRLGHAQSSTTLNVYGHALPAGDEATAVVLARALDGVQPAP